MLVPDRTLPGEALIEPGETEGLPAAVPSDNEDRSTWSRARTDPTALRSVAAASKLVKAHSRGARFLAGFGAGSKGKRKDKKATGDVLGEVDPAKTKRKKWGTPLFGDDVEKDAQHIEASPSPNPPLGSGVLSALLALYDRPRSSGHVSGTATPSSTGSSTPFEHEANDHQERHRSSRIRGHTLAAHDGQGDPEGHTKPPSPGAAAALRAARTMHNVTDKLAEGIALPRVLAVGDHRPSQARNAGGVFGTLIASTGNLSGVAAPGPSQIAPNPSKPGFHISRYDFSSFKHLTLG